MESTTKVLDTSALLAWIQNEPGGNYVEYHLSDNCILSTVNLAELATKLVDSHHAYPEKIGQQLRTLGVKLVPLTEEQAITAGILRKTTRAKGLSLGDRACLALAQQLNAEVLTTDQAWLELELNITITNIRAP